MTTLSTKTPVSFGCAPLHRHAPSRASPIRARLSIGPPRSNALLLAVVSPRTTFTSVDAHAPVPARTRRSGGLPQVAPERTDRDSVRPETPVAPSPRTV